MIGPVVERLHGQGVDEPRGGLGLTQRLDAADVGEAEGLRRWLAQAPEDRVLVQVLALGGHIVVLYRERVGERHGA